MNEMSANSICFQSLWSSLLVAETAPAREQSITAGVASGNIVAKVIPVVPAATPAVTVADIGSADICPLILLLILSERLRGNKKGHPMAALEKQKPRRGRVSMFDFVLDGIFHD